MELSDSIIEQEFLDCGLSHAKCLAATPSRRLYRFDSPTGFLLAQLHLNGERSLVSYQEHENAAFVAPCLWTLLSLEEWKEKFKKANPICFLVYAKRNYREAKLTKPSELKGLQACFSVAFQKTKCPCYIRGDDIWIKHRDFFSPSWQTPTEDMGKGTANYAEKYFGKKLPSKFIYDDNFGDIVLRSEAWLRIENLVPLIKRRWDETSADQKSRNVLENEQSVVWTLLKAASVSLGVSLDFSHDWEVFFEVLVLNTIDFGYTREEKLEWKA